MTAIDLEDVVANIDFHLQGIAKELAKGGDQITAHQATRLWMDCNKLTRKIGELKNKAQARDWKDAFDFRYENEGGE